jgi:hypothetical protein
MFRSEPFESKLKFAAERGVAACVCMLLAVTVASVLAPMAAAQGGTSEFTLTAASFNPDAVAPGGVSSSLLTIGSVNGFSGTVNLSCQVTSPQQTTDTPVCTVSPASVSVPGTATATVTTQTGTTTVGYSVTVTGTGPTTTFTTPSLPLTVLAVTPQFTITVTSAIAPTSVPAGSGSTGTVTVNPINGYVSDPSNPNAGVTLACASISPLETIAPVCTFTYPPGKTSLPVTGNAASATLTISTFGPVTTGAALYPRGIYGLWLALPLFGLIAVGGTRGKRARKVCGVLTLVMLGGALMLVPGCATSTTSTTTPNGVTPANTYSFTIIGVDQDGVVSSNTSSTTSAGPTVSLTVTAPVNP